MTKEKLERYERDALGFRRGTYGAAGLDHLFAGYVLGLVAEVRRLQALVAQLELEATPYCLVCDDKHWGNCPSLEKMAEEESPLAC